MGRCDRLRKITKCRKKKSSMLKTDSWVSILRENIKEKMREHEREHFSQSVCFFIQICLLWSLFVLLRFWQLEAINFRITRLIELDLWSLQSLIHFCFLDEVKDYFRMNNENEADFHPLKTSLCWRTSADGRSRWP